MRTKPLLVVALLAAQLSCFSALASAQVDPAAETLSGRVVIDNEKPDRNTRIWIFEAKSGKGYTVQQDSDGKFKISLPEGYYFVFIANFGFVPYAKEIWLQQGKPIKLVVKLDPDWANAQDVS
jgi:hypothetical protein